MINGFLMLNEVLMNHPNFCEAVSMLLLYLLQPNPDDRCVESVKHILDHMKNYKHGKSCEGGPGEDDANFGISVVLDNENPVLYLTEHSQIF